MIADQPVTVLHVAGRLVLVHPESHEAAACRYTGRLMSHTQSSHMQCKAPTRFDMYEQAMQVVQCRLC